MTATKIARKVRGRDFAEASGHGLRCCPTLVGVVEMKTKAENSYRFEAAHVSGFMQELVRYVSHGYRYYVTAEVPARKDVARVDEKLVSGYGIAMSRWARARRKRAGKANLQYLRHDRFFVLIATPGEHVFFKRENPSDIRERALCYGGYEVRSVLGPDGKWHASVRIADDQYRRVCAHLEELAPRVSRERLALELEALPFEPWAPVATQFRALRARVNRARRRAGVHGDVPMERLRLRRKSLRGFVEKDG